MILSLKKNVGEAYTSKDCLSMPWENHWPALVIMAQHRPFPGTDLFLEQAFAWHRPSE